MKITILFLVALLTIVLIFVSIRFQTPITDNPNIQSNSEAMFSLLKPDDIEWSNTETGEFTLKINNMLEPQTFYINIYPESGIKEWIGYQDQVFLNTGQEASIAIIVNPANAEAGEYKYNIFVCSTPLCTFTSSSLLATTFFTFRIV